MKIKIPEGHDWAYCNCQICDLYRLELREMRQELRQKLKRQKQKVTLDPAAIAVGERNRSSRWLKLLVMQELLSPPPPDDEENGGIIPPRG